MDIFYTITCIIPFILCVDVVLLHLNSYDNFNKNVRSVINLSLISVLLAYNIVYQLYYQLIIPIITILFIIIFHLCKNIKDKKKQSIIISNLNPRISFNIYSDDMEFDEDVHEL